MEGVCSRCGCSRFHYNHRRMRMECDSCGAPWYDAGQEQQRMQYDRTYAQAMGHLTAGNWDRALSMLKQLADSHPTEKRVYQAILQAATQNFQDFRMGNASRKAAARDAWDKLARLRGVSGEMLRYGRQRREEQNRQKGKMFRWLLAAAGCALLAGLCLEAMCYSTATALSAGFAGCLFRVYTLHPEQLLERWLNPAPEDKGNPFR